MPKPTAAEAAEKERAMQEALVGACEVPLAIMRACAAVIDECDFLARPGSRMAVSDAGVAVAFARSALLGASLNVYINIGSLLDEERARSYRADADNLIADGVARADAVYALVARHPGRAGSVTDVARAGRMRPRARPRGVSAGPRGSRAMLLGDTSRARGALPQRFVVATQPFC